MHQNDPRRMAEVQRQQAFIDNKIQQYWHTFNNINLSHNPDESDYDFFLRKHGKTFKIEFPEESKNLQGNEDIFTGSMEGVQITLKNDLNGDRTDNRHLHNYKRHFSLRVLTPLIRRQLEQEEHEEALQRQGREENVRREQALRAEEEARERDEHKRLMRDAGAPPISNDLPPLTGGVYGQLNFHSVPSLNALRGLVQHNNNWVFEDNLQGPNSHVKIWPNGRNQGEPIIVKPYEMSVKVEPEQNNALTPQAQQALTVLMDTLMATVNADIARERQVRPPHGYTQPELKEIKHIWLENAGTAAKAFCKQYCADNGFTFSTQRPQPQNNDATFRVGPSM